MSALYTARDIDFRCIPPRSKSIPYTKSNALIASKLDKTSTTHSTLRFALLATTLLPLISALGINCRGSGLCPRAGWNDPQSESIMQILRDAVWASTKDNSTTYNSDDHIICISESQSVTITAGAGYDGVSGSFSLNGNIGEGGICLFPQDLAAPNIDLGTVRPLVDKLLEHGCSVCGSIPVHEIDEGSNDPKDGILTFNYVAAPYCVGDCISDTGSVGSAAARASSAPATTTS
ncbi:hypothetical protein MMC20_008021 [Loxospora ochrophaea]|nr:hypothetical protein [Loxospora ochrophaea]